MANDVERTLIFAQDIQIGDQVAEFERSGRGEGRGRPSGGDIITVTNIADAPSKDGVIISIIGVNGRGQPAAAQFGSVDAVWLYAPETPPV